MPDEAFVDGAIEQRKERIVKAADIEEVAALVMKAELRPGDRLAEPFECAESARQSDECVRQLRHYGLAFMHGAHDSQVWKAAMGKFACDEGVGNDPDGMPAGGQYRIGQNAYQPHAAAAEYEADTACGQLASDAKLELTEHAVFWDVSSDT